MISRISEELAAPPFVWAGAAKPISDKPTARAAKRTERRKRIFIRRRFADLRTVD